MSNSSVEHAISEIAAGRMIVVVDDEDRENEGDLIMAADLVTAQDINFMATHARGLICVSLSEERIAQLALPRMDANSTAVHDTAFTVSVDLPGEGRTGISAFDRADTIQALCDPATRPDDLARPAHIFPLAVRPGGALQRSGHTEASHDLAVLAGRFPAGVLVEVMAEDGTMARGPELERGTG
ncbi:3,4-dihydroxy-2-butanone-4-phosphate synthase [Saccharopolyspora sp. NPDC050642]|uniref:3,4-dihydroxy-2-butanone-4-phosphate synthase n=1 Tax=Saccharopolyspora sp. NPDC050642 TaxID=3157099 RepID=UPI0033D263BB